MVCQAFMCFANKSFICKTMLVIYSTAKGQALRLEACWAICDRVISHAVRDNARDSAPDISMGQFTA